METQRPIQRFQNLLLVQDRLSQARIDEMEAEAKRIVDAAQRDAESLPYPPEEFLYQGVYAE